MSGSAELKEVAYGIVVERDVMVAVRDGVRLATDIYRPARDGVAAEGKFPVILERTPYGKALASRSEVDRGMTKARPRPRRSPRSNSSGTPRTACSSGTSASIPTASPIC